MKRLFDVGDAFGSCNVALLFQPHVCENCTIAAKIMHGRRASRNTELTVCISKEDNSFMEKTIAEPEVSPAFHSHYDGMKPRTYSGNDAFGIRICSKQLSGHVYPQQVSYWLALCIIVVSSCRKGLRRASRRCIVRVH